MHFGSKFVFAGGLFGLVLLGSVVDPTLAYAEGSFAISTPTALAQALGKARAGTTLLLSPGDYGALDVRGLAGSAGNPVLLRAADPANPPRFSGMDLRGVAHVTIENVVFDYVFAVGNPTHLRPFQIWDSTDVTIRRVLFDGDSATGSDANENGFPTGYGLGIQNVTGLNIEASEFRDFARGMIITESRDITLRQNDIHSIRSDGMDLAQVRNVLIEANHIHDFKRSADSGDHADMIQFWTAKTTKPSVGIVIRGNLLNSGAGLYTQSIFMRNDLVDRGIAGAEMFYRDIRIEENVIINAHAHGITVGETAGLVIANNTLIRNPASAGAKENKPLWTPQIRVAEASRDVAVLRNAAYSVIGKERQRDWTVEENLPIQDVTRLRAWFYETVFVAATTGNPQDLASFRYLPGGPLDNTGIGARWLDTEQAIEWPLSGN
jgi:Right handed beta helix region